MVNYLKGNQIEATPTFFIPNIYINLNKFKTVPRLNNQYIFNKKSALLLVLLYICDVYFKQVIFLNFIIKITIILKAYTCVFSVKSLNLAQVPKVK